MRTHILITGVTGLIGRYLACNALAKGMNVAVLCRPRGSESAEERIRQVLDQWKLATGQQLPMPKCLVGDIRRFGLGLDATSRQWIDRHCSSILHNAASVQFQSDQDGEPWSSNVEGTRNVIELCREMAIDELHFMSSAYVCGVRRDIAYEQQFDCGQMFRNDYEESKFKAERLVREADFIRSRTVYRPSIVVGDSRTGFTTSYHNVYLFLQFTSTIAQYAPRDLDGRWQHKVRMNMCGSERINLVPVDWVSAVTCHILARPELHGKTYHITAAQAATSAEIERALGQFLNYYGVTFAGRGPMPGDLNEREQLFYAALAGYSSYWFDDPLFDRTNLEAAVPNIECPNIDLPCLLRLFEYAIGARFGKARRRPRHSSAKPAQVF